MNSLHNERIPSQRTEAEEAERLAGWQYALDHEAGCTTKHDNDPIPASKLPDFAQKWLARVAAKGLDRELKELHKPTDT